MTDHLSASQMNLYMQCSLKYKFQYVDQLPKPFRPSGLVLGSAIHSAISWFHKRQLSGQEASLEKVYRIFEADWYSQRVENDIRFRDNETEGGLTLLGKEILGLYCAQPKKAVQGSEIPFTVPLIHPKNHERLPVNLEGFIDLVEPGDVIVEFKTSLKAMDIKEVGLQLSAYSYAYQRLAQRLPTLLRLVNFVKTKKPKMLVMDMKEADHERFFHLAKQVLNGIQSQVFFPRQSFWCQGCEYQDPCQAWAGG